MCKNIREKKFSTIRQFTLIELLIVVTILVVLAAILVPVLSKARAKTHIVLCMNNQRQILIGSMNYARDNDQSVLFSNWKSHEDSLNDYKGPGWLYDWTLKGPSWDQDDVKTSAIYTYLGFIKPYRCPSHVKNIGNGTRKLTSYMINGVTTDYAYNDNKPLDDRHFFKLSNFSSDHVIFLESNPDGPPGMWNDGANFPVERGTSGGMSQLTDRHFGKAQIGFFDGHTESLRDEDYLDMLGEPGSLYCCPFHTNGR